MADQDAFKDLLAEGPQMDRDTVQFLFKGVVERLPEGAAVTPEALKAGIASVMTSPEGLTRTLKWAAENQSEMERYIPRFADAMSKGFNPLAMMDSVKGGAVGSREDMLREIEDSTGLVGAVLDEAEVKYERHRAEIANQENNATVAAVEPDTAAGRRFQEMLDHHGGIGEAVTMGQQVLRGEHGDDAAGELMRFFGACTDRLHNNPQEISSLVGVDDGDVAELAEGLAQAMDHMLD